MSVETETSWEGRVEALEREKREMAAQLEASTAKITALEAAAEAERVAAKARKAREIDAAMADLQRKATGYQCPLSAEDLGKVRAAYDAGLDEIAGHLAEAFLSRSQAIGARSTADQGGERLYPASADAEKAKASAAYVAGQLRASGWAVELSADGTQIVSKTPPAQRAGR